MKRILMIIAMAATAAISSMLWAAVAAEPATLISSTGTFSIRTIEDGGQPLFSADDILRALGGVVVPAGQGFTATLAGVEGNFGMDSRFAVVGETMIELPATPVVVETSPFLPWQFFQSLAKAGPRLSLTWDPATRALQVQPIVSQTVSPQVSVVNLQNISKVVIRLGEVVDYSIVKESGAWTIRFRDPVRAPFPSQTYDDPRLARITFNGSDMRLDLASAEVVGDAYRLENPFRIIIDLQKGAPSLPPPPPGTTILSRPGELPKVRTIVIDPGHGGKDVGAIGAGGLLEKDATLAIAKKLAAILTRTVGGRVVLTRSDDSAIPLDQRTAIANQYQADLFVSIHLNAARTKGAKGSETYFLSLDASDELARRAAERENETAAVAPGAAADLRFILWDLAQQDYMKESSQLAELIQEELSRASGVENRGVKQAPFKVLVGATMPAALVEVAFISNSDDEVRLRTEEFQTSIATTLATAVERFKRRFEPRNSAEPGTVAPDPAAKRSAPATAAVQPPKPSAATNR